MLKSQPLRTVGDSDGRFNANWQLVRNLYTAGYNAEELRETFHLLDWMLRLRGELEATFKQQWIAVDLIRGGTANASHCIDRTLGAR